MKNFKKIHTIFCTGIILLNIVCLGMKQDSPPQHNSLKPPPPQYMPSLPPLLVDSKQTFPSLKQPPPRLSRPKNAPPIPSPHIIHPLPPHLSYPKSPLPKPSHELSTLQADPPSYNSAMKTFANMQSCPNCEQQIIESRCPRCKRMIRRLFVRSCRQCCTSLNRALTSARCHDCLAMLFFPGPVIMAYSSPCAIHAICSALCGSTCSMPPKWVCFLLSPFVVPITIIFTSSAIPQFLAIPSLIKLCSSCIERTTGYCLEHCQE